MADIEPEQENELKRALNRRRQEVDSRGLHFAKNPEQAARTADVTWEEQHESQFTPRSRHQRAVEAALASSRRQEALQGKEEEPVAESQEPAASSGDAAGGTPVVGSDSGTVSSRLQRSGFILDGTVGNNEPTEPASPGAASTASSTKTTSTIRVSTAPQPTVLVDATLGINTRPAAVPSLRISSASSTAWGPGTHPAGSLSTSESAGAAAREGHASGSAEVWHAVVEGNLSKLVELAAQGVLNSGRMLDHNGHSIFWNAVAFQQPEVALFLLQRFPPGEAPFTSVDLGEVHARRGDSLLHLCLYLSDFSTSAAEVFRSVFRAGESPQAPRELANQHGQTFVHIAAARLNFWVLRFILSNSPDTAVLFQRRDSMGHTPLEILLRRFREITGFKLTRPAPLAPPPSEKLPPWSELRRYVPRSSGSAATLPFADLIVEVEDRASEDGVARVQAHRVVLAANSGIFHKKLQSLPIGKPLHLDPLCCRSVEVLLVVLSFLYSGELACAFQEDAFLLWQLLCLCTQYALPAPLAVYARTALLHSLGSARHAPVVPVLLQAADKVGLTSDEGLYAACVLLSSAQAVPGASGNEAQAQALLSALAEVERSVLRSQDMPGTPLMQPSPQQAKHEKTTWLLQRQSSKLLVPAGCGGAAAMVAAACQPPQASICHAAVPAAGPAPLGVAA